MVGEESRFIATLRVRWGMRIEGATPRGGYVIGIVSDTCTDFQAGCECAKVTN